MVSDGYISDEQYLHLQNVWNTFNFNNFEDFHDHYLKKVVLSLADIFQKFIFTCLKYYNLDPCCYFSALGLSWDAMLKMTGVTLEKIRDPDKYIFLNKEWGLLIKRYSETSKNKHILYLDMNLCGCAMRQYLPISNFEWSKTLIKSNKN